MAHEKHGFEHAAGNIGPAIGGRYCAGLTQVWNIDKDGDGITDACIQIIFTHDRMHIKNLPLINGGCHCPTEDEK